jgi:hypothetical protein
LGTMCKGEAHGDFDLRQHQQILTFLTLLGDLRFFWIEAAGFCKNRGVATGVDVMLDPMGWCRLHITVAKNEGEFCNKVFTSGGMESGIV